jgi:hypothetical protein
MVLRLTRSITEISTKGDRSLGSTTLTLSCADCHKIWEPQPPGTPQGLSRPVQGLLYLFYHPTEGMIGFLRLKAMLHSVLQLLNTAISHSHKIKTESN